MNRGEFQQKIVEKALREPDFRKKLMANPKEAIHECFPEIPISSLKDVNIKVYEEKSKEMILTIPTALKEPLTEEQLTEVSGGQMDFTRFMRSW